MNAIHARFAIANDDFLYVLSTFVFEPIRWNARFGWRPMTEAEKLGWFLVLARRRRAHGDPRPARRHLPRSSASTSTTSASASASRGESPGRAGDARDVRRLGSAARSGRLVRRAIRRPARRAGAHRVRLEAGAALADVGDCRGAAHARGVAALAAKRRRPRLRTRIARSDYPRGYTIESLGPPPS
jgi:hypothetical protein